MIRTKKLVALMLAMAMCFSLCATAFAAPLASALAKADGNAYFYFWASDLKVEAPNNFKVGYAVNGSDPIYFTNNFPSRTERFDKTLLKQGQVNTFTIFTGDTNAMINESLSRKEAGTNCLEFSVITTALNLVLPDGRVVYPSKVLSYAPKNETTPLKDDYNVVENKDSRIYLGDNTLTSYWKMDVQFDLTNISWSDIPSVLPVVKNVSLQIGADPKCRNLVWYSTSNNASVAQVALKSAMTTNDFPANPQTFSATSEITGLTGYKSYKTTMTDLNANTEYVYRVGNEIDGWSEIYSFKTTNFSGDFSFVAVADPQLGQGREMGSIQEEISSWETTLSKMNENFPITSFLACMGDMVSETCIESESDSFFAPQLLKSYTLAVVPGNHDYDANYTPHYNMPNVSSLGVHNSMGAGSGDYYFTYNDALFMGINGRCYDNNEHIRFIEETIKKHPDAKWKILMMHEALYGATDQGFRTDYIIALREELTAHISRLGIDVVLDGHEHCYSRSYLINEKGEPNLSTGGSSVTDPDPSQVLYVTLGSASGTDYCDPMDSNNLPCVAKIVGDRTPKFTKVDIKASSLTIETYRVDNMEKVDTFTIERTKPAVKSIFVSPQNVTVKAGETQQFGTEIYGCDNPSKDVIWSVSDAESDKTVISQQGVLSVDVNETAETLTVTATSAVNPSKAASATVSVGSSITTVNAGLGVKYMLPKTVDNNSVTWKDSAGNTVQYADTSKTGYRFYTGTLDDSTEIKYRVNVGEYKTLMEDDFESYAEAQYKTKVTNTDMAGGYFSKGEYKGNTDEQQLTKDGNNTIAAFGPTNSEPGNFKWVSNDKAKGEAFRLSYKLRVKSLDLDTVDNGYLFSVNFEHVPSVQLRVMVDSNKKITETLLRCNGTAEKSANIGNFVKWSAPDNGNVVYMEDYITIELEGNDVQYAAKVNGTEVANSIPWSNIQYISNGVQSINMGRKSYGSTLETAVIYIDEMKFSKAVYVEGNIKKTPVETTLYCGDSSSQTAVATLKMTDGSTKNFTVNYVADTATAGVKTASGTIDGIDTPITVKYTVKPGMTINAGLGVKYMLPKTVDNNSVTWKDSAGNTVTYADTSKVGYRFYNGTLADSTEVKCRVNVGEYKTLMEDDFESYAEAQYKTKVTNTDMAGGYFSKNAYVTNTDEQQLTKDGNNTIAAFGPTESKLDFKWVSNDKAKGEAFKLSYKMRVNSLDLDTVKSGSPDGYLFSVNFEHVPGVQLRVVVENNKITKTQLRCNGTEEKFADISNFVKWSAPDNGNVVSMEDYITIELEGNDVQYAAKVNGTEVADSIPWSNIQYISNGVQSINMAKRSFGSPLEVAVTYIDKMEFSKAVYAADRINEIPVATTLYNGDASLQTAVAVIKMSDGSTKNFTVNYVADTRTDGVKTAAGTIEGFDDSITVTYTVVTPTVIAEIANNSDGKTQVKLRNNIILDAGTKLFVAVYDKTSEVIKKACIADLNETQRNTGDQTVNLSEDMLVIPNSTVKTFIWDKQLKPLILPFEIMK